MGPLLLPSLHRSQARKSQELAFLGWWRCKVVTRVKVGMASEWIRPPTVAEVLQALFNIGSD